MNNLDLSYWKKQETPLFKDLEWNFPERKSGTITLLGGNSAAFATEIKISEFLLNSFPIEEIKTVLPDALKSKLPPLPNLSFAPSTDSGSFKPSSELELALENSDFNLFLGDFSKNSETAVAISDLLKTLKTPALLTRDTLDLVSSDANTFIENENLMILGSLIQLQKLFRALYYPKMILLSSPLVPIIEALHKFTLTYPVSILTFHDGKILTAKDGNIISTEISKTEYSPISLWDGRLAARTAVFTLFNPKKPLKSLNAALFYQ